MDSRNRRIAGLLLAGGLALALLGQVYFGWRRQYVRDGAVFYALGALCWAAALRRLSGARQRLVWPLRALRAARADPLRAGLLAASSLLCAGAGVAAVRARPDAGFGLHLLAWVLGLVLFLAAVAPAPSASLWRRLMERARARWVELAGLAGLLAAALVVRVVALETVPVNFGGDEGTQVLAALRLVQPPLGNPFSTGWYSVPTMSFLAYGLAMRVFGFTVAGGRVLSALIGTATVLATFLLMRELTGRWVAWTAAVLVAFGHYAVHFSRLASNQVADAFFAALAFYLVVRGLRSETGRMASWWLGLAGVVLGASWYGYYGARLAPVVIVLYLVWRALAEPRFLKRQGRGLVLMVVGALLAVAPLVFHYVAYPERLLSRYNQVSIFASGWLEREVVITGRSAASLLLQQFWKSVSAFNFTPDPTFWYHPGTPLLDSLSGLFFVLGLTAATVRARQPGRGLLLISFWSFVFLGWVFTENPPSSQRGVGVVPVMAGLTALGLVETVGLIQRLAARRGAGGPQRRPYGRALLALLLSVIVVVNLVFYFAIYTPRRVYGNPTAEISDVLCDALEEREVIPPVYFDGAPVMYWDFGAIAFRLRGVEGQDFSPETGMHAVDRSRGALFVVLEDRLMDLPEIQAAFPGGASESFYSEADERLLFALYEVPMRADP
jgi:4-amino-4-deoxy-L-arabinose transferase-like glycosyltransferase